MKAYDDDGAPLKRCDCCENGNWYAACCNGAGGCSCRGELVDMGPCHVCHGTGWKRPDADTRANVRTIEGQCFIGSGPADGWFGRS